MYGLEHPLLCVLFTSGYVYIEETAACSNYLGAPVHVPGMPIDIITSSTNMASMEIKKIHTNTSITIMDIKKIHTIASITVMDINKIHTTTSNASMGMNKSLTIIISMAKALEYCRGRNG